MKILLYIVVILAIIFLYKKYTWSKKNPAVSNPNVGFFDFGNSQAYLYYVILNNPIPGNQLPQ